MRVRHARSRTADLFAVDAPMAPATAAPTRVPGPPQGHLPQRAHRRQLWYAVRFPALDGAVDPAAALERLARHAQRFLVEFVGEERVEIGRRDVAQRDVRIGRR